MLNLWVLVALFIMKLTSSSGVDLLYLSNHLKRLPVFVHVVIRLVGLHTGRNHRITNPIWLSCKCLRHRWKRTSGEHNMGYLQ